MAREVEAVSIKWTDEMVETVLAMWRNGRTAAEIAAVLPERPSRNSVLGKIHRTLHARGEPSKQGATPPRQHQPKTPGQRPSTRRSPPTLASVASPETRPERRAAASKPAVAPPRPGLALVLAPPPRIGVITVEMLGSDTCRWPIGDPQEPDFTFCGHKPREASVYCDYHTRLAYEPRQDRRRKAER